MKQKGESPECKKGKSVQKHDRNSAHKTHVCKEEKTKTVDMRGNLKSMSIPWFVKFQDTFHVSP